jgi:hypothetical protein
MKKIIAIQGTVFLVMALSFQSFIQKSTRKDPSKAIPLLTANENKTEKLPGTLYEEWRITPAPNSGKSVSVNPPALLWPSEKKMHNKNVMYRVYLSKDPSFPEGKTFVGEKQKFCLFNSHKKLEPGVWYWKYDIIEQDKTHSPGTYSFVVKPETTVFETPLFKDFLAQISKNHPRVMNQGRDIELIRKKAPNHLLYKEILLMGEKALKAEIYRGPVTDKNEAIAKALTKKTGNEVDRYLNLLEAYVLSGNKAMLNALIERTNVLLTWPTNDLLGSEVLMSLAKGYDILFDDLDSKMKDSMLKIIGRQIDIGLSDWPGNIEARQVENHFWQVALCGNFTASLATLHDLKSSIKMLEYTYELFIARFPNLATQEGGWAEGIGYFGVNKSAIVDMAVLLKKVGGVDVFKMNWYKNLADYFTYFAPVNGRISGFGDMHDRVGSGNVGHAMMLVVGMENQDDKALFRLSTLMKAKRTDTESEEWIDKELRQIEPWYQIVNDINFDRNKILPPKKMESAKVFYGTGEAAMHTDVLNSGDNTAVYFRSSPFGAKGHMHANQNCFNISRKGEPLFYSSGYYTTFADPHSLTSYRHTRAHNGILVNGFGQSFGHEGYGWIKRFINGAQLSYVCGDATMAYRPMVDEQFLELNSKNNIQQTPEFGFGDAKLKLFERHMIFVHPATLIVYDVLESEEPAEWSFLLHSMKKPELDDHGILMLNTGMNYAEVRVMGSGALASPT